MDIAPEDGPSLTSERTAIQPSAAIADSKGLSVPQDIKQHAYAPKIPGYILTKVLGRGAFAEVWKAWQIRTHKCVAVKVFTQRNGINWIFLQREVERLIKLDKHPHIVSLLDADLMGEPAYYVMDFLEEGSLDQFVGSGKPAPPEKAARWMEEIAEALAYVHSKGLIHCDLKPANILLDEEGHVRVADFGQSRIVTDSAGALGTLFYMAPEQSAATKNGEQVQPDVRWDVYGLGTTMWAVLTGSVPHGDPDNRKLLNAAKSLEEKLRVYRETVNRQPLAEPSRVTGGKVDEDLSAIVVKCARAEAAGRHLTVAEVLADLKARREIRPVSPLAHERKYRVKTFLHRNLKLVALSAAAGLSLLAAGAQIARKNAALHRAGASLTLKDRALKEAGTEIERKSAALQQQRADSYAARGEVHLKTGDFAAAAICYAESNRISPSHRARANALAALAAMKAPLQVWFHDDPVTTVAFGPDGKTALTGGADGTARLWDARTGAPLGQRTHRKGLGTAVAVSPDGRTVLSGSSNGTASLRDARTGAPLGQKMRHEGPVGAVAFSPDGKTVLTGSSDGTARLWEAGTGAPLGQKMRREGLAAAVAFSPDGKTVFAGSRDGTARLWDARTGAPFGKVLRHEKEMRAAAFSPDGRTVLTGGSDRTARFWDAGTGEPLGEALRHEDQVIAVAFSPDAKTVLTGSSDRTAQLWDAGTGEPLGKALRHEGQVRSVAIGPDGKTVLTGSMDATARLWDAATGEPVGRVLRHKGEVRSVAISPDGKIALTGSVDATARFWDARTGEPRGKVLRHEDGVRAVAFSPDGRTALTVSADAAARLWDAQTGEPIGQIRSGVQEAAFSPDGKTVLIDSDNIISLWDVRWLAERVDADDLELRTGVSAKMRINASGDMERIPFKEWRYLHQKLRAQDLAGAEVVAPSPERPVPPGFHKSVTRHFSVFAEEGKAPDRFLEMIERLHGEMMLDLEPFSPWAADRKVEIFLFKSKDAYRRVTGRPPWSGGAASVKNRTVYVYDSAEMPALLANLLGSVYYDGFYIGGHDSPLWLSSGMATLIQAERGGGAPPWLRENIQLLAQGGGFSSEELMSVTSTKGLSGAKARLWAAQAYSVVRYLMRAQDKASFYKFSEYLREGKDPAHALSLDYGMSLKALDDAWRAGLADAARKDNTLAESNL